MKVYYAHPVSLYDTKVEKRDIELLQKLGFEVVNPNAPEHTAAYGQRKRDGITKDNGFEYFVELAATCDLCAFRAFPSGDIGSGVGKEVASFIFADKPVIELPTGVMRRTMPIELTKEVLRDSGAR